MVDFAESVAANGAGFMTDDLIRQALDNGEIFESGTWSPEEVQYCSYVLRMGKHVDYPQRRSAGKDADAHRVLVRHSLQVGETITLAPGDTVLAGTMEKFRLRDDMAALTIPRGLLYAESLLVASSYVDPGFNDEFFIPITNVSDRTVRLPYGLTLVRVFFVRLQSPVSKPFRHGATSSLEQELETMPSVESPDAQQCRALSSDDLLLEIERGVPSGAAVAEMMKRNVAEPVPKLQRGDLQKLSYRDLNRYAEGDVANGVAIKLALQRQLQRFLVGLVAALLFITGFIVLLSTQASVRKWVGGAAVQIGYGVVASAVFLVLVAAARRWRKQD